MDRTVFVIHGLGGNPQENWFPWLTTELTSRGMQVTVPQFPHASTPVLSEWLSFFSPFTESIGGKTTMIGHSLGATFILRYLEKTDITVDTVVLVAGPLAKMGNSLDEIVQTFTFDAFDWKAIASRAKQFSLVYSDNDPYVPLTHGQNAARELGVELHLVHDGGHLNAGSGFTEFPLLLSLLP